MTEHSGNGWVASANPHDIGVVAFAPDGHSFPGGVRGGDVAYLFTYLVHRFAREVQPLGDGCWGYAYRPNRNDPNSLSNHASGTAIDINAPLHPNGKAGTFTTAQVTHVHAILTALGGVIRWGGDYHSTVDAMHFEINIDAAHVAAQAEKLRAAANRYPVLKFGSHGPAVLRYTVALNKHGFPTSDRDIFGNPTFRETKALQAKHGLQQTGVAGEAEQRAVGL